MAKNNITIIKQRKLCLDNAEMLLSVAERELSKNVDHICFHLALLSLEEIGKSVLVTIGYTVSTADKEKGGLTEALDDHIKKIFWALWSELLSKNKITKEEIDQIKHLATNLHEKRLLYLYADPKTLTDPKDKIGKDEAGNLIKLTRARLELEKLNKVEDHPKPEDIEILKWFFDATENIDKRRLIFSANSIKKLQESKNGKDWMRWLKNVSQQNEEEMIKLAEQELNRQKPSSNEEFNPKYKMRIRIQSQSHSIRNNTFQEWNNGVDNIRLYKSDKKNLPEFAKSEFFADFTFPKAIPIHALWNHGFFMAKTLVISFNIATKGLFWWNVQKDVEKFFEYISDLEADKNGSVQIGMRKGKRLAIDWGNMTLDQKEMNRVNMIFAYLLREHKKLQKFLATYSLGIVMFGKTDIHLRMEINAFEEFFKAFKKALIILGDWDGKTDLKTVAKTRFSELSTFEEFNKIMQMGIDLQNKKVLQITLTEVASMKLYCDFYIQLKASEYFKNMKENKKK